MWLFDVIKIVTSSTVPVKKKKKERRIKKPSKSHKTKVTVTFLKERSIQVLAHPPYSPNLAISDFWVFPLITEKLVGLKFSNSWDLARAVNSVLHVLSPYDYQSTCL